MIQKFIHWLKDRFEGDPPSKPGQLRKTAAYAHGPPKTAAATVPARESTGDNVRDAVKLDATDPGKSAPLRIRYIREETGTHETLKILDDSIMDTGEETGIDPYNTGGFDRSKNWAKRYRK